MNRRIIGGIGALIGLVAMYAAAPKLQPPDKVALAEARVEWLKLRYAEEFGGMIDDRKLAEKATGDQKPRLLELVKADKERVDRMLDEIRDLEVRIRELMAERRRELSGITAPPVREELADPAEPIPGPPLERRPR